MDKGVDYCGLVKTSHNGFCLATLEKFMKYWPGDSYPVLKSTIRVPVDRPTLAIGYKYHSRKVLGFISTDVDGSTELVDAYLSISSDIYSNVSVPTVVCNNLLVRYFNDCNQQTIKI